MTHVSPAGRIRLLAAVLGLATCFATVAADKAKPAQPAARSVATSTAFSYSVEPAPAWVVPAKENPNAAVTAAPLRYRVVDDQTRIEGSTAHMYSHVVRVVGDTAGLSQASQIEIEFDPSYQTLALHHVDIVREGRRSTRLDRKRIQLLQRETQLERRIYDGRVTASMVLDDVRVGDQVDFAYSIRGLNPVFGGRFVSMEWMISHRGPAALYQYRLLAPESRKIQHRTMSPEIQVSSKVDRGMRETVFRREAVPQFHADPGSPYGVVLKQEVQFSEFDDWADVARWGLALFTPSLEGGAAVERKAAEIKAASGDPQQQLLAALRFVQADVRYFGTEIGLNSHKPALPDKVIEQRFGDCKDKVSLLVALLRKLDIAAQPVLVSTLMRGHVDEVIASPLAFDHVIARVDLQGRTYYLDATRGHQSGTLDKRQSAGLEKGLLVASGTQSITTLPSVVEQQRMSVHDIFRVKRFADGASLEARITYRGDLAESMRESLATRNVSEIQTQLGTAYARAYPKLATEAPMEVLRSDTDDAVTFVLHFAIPEFWRFPEQRALVGDIVHWSVIEALRFPNDTQRRDPFSIAFPGRFTHVSTVEFGDDVYATPSTQTMNDGDSHFNLRNTAEIGARRSEYTSELRVMADQVDPRDWPAYTTLVGKMGPRVGVSVSSPALPLAAVEDLRRELRDIDEQVRSQKLKPKTQTQFQSMVKARVLSAQLDAGRLAPNLKAQALTARGIQYDNLGRYAEAAQDFKLALELAPDVPETLNGAAVNALQLKDYAVVMTLTGKVLARNPSDTEARNTRAVAAYFNRDYAAAMNDFDELLKDRAQVRRGYPLVWLALASRSGGIEMPKGSEAIPDEQLPSEWPRPLVDWARGKASVDAVIASAKAGGSAAERLCEAYFYIGERYLAEGDTARAREFFQKSVDQGVTEFIEDGSSRLRLASLKR
ncbi:DUF3857 domain-containing protein [Piscinibacter terrae]|uniref:DUF3857 domain-containing protein n=1 Tax=Piscinibacter terrae TaxID=2496871 RepID=A0A3N7HQJ4_9BURK|nr:DUF3857 domain-containing protein [Albitalea terrae]RQP23031.1 DUF3857 domain-containing protein [Albitalea terrae]